MKKPPFFAACAVLAFMAAVGCATTGYYPSAGAEKYPPTDKLEVLRYSPGRPYVVLGNVTVTGNSENTLLPKLKKKAMSIGADAIILRPARRATREYVSQRRTEISTSKIVLEAVAIRYQELK